MASELLLANALVKVVTDSSGVKAGLGDIEKQMGRSLSHIEKSMAEGFMGGVRQAGGGCLCPEHSLLAATVSGMRLRRRDVVLMDTHAGVEHFGRALARGFDQAVVVADPSYPAVDVAVRTARLAADLGIGRIHLALNRVRHEEDLARGLAHLETLGGFPFASVHPLPHDDAALDTEPSVAGLLDGSPLARAAGGLAARIQAALW